MDKTLFSLGDEAVVSDRCTVAAWRGKTVKVVDVQNFNQNTQLVDVELPSGKIWKTDNSMLLAKGA